MRDWIFENVAGQDKLPYITEGGFYKTADIKYWRGVAALYYNHSPKISLKKIGSLYVNSYSGTVDLYVWGIINGPHSSIKQICADGLLYEKALIQALDVQQWTM